MDKATSRIASVSRWCAIALFAIAATLAQANTPAAPAGHAIGSASFNELLDKQKQPGMFATEQRADGSFLLKNTMQTVSAHVTPQGVQFDSIGNSAGKGGFGLQLVQWGRAGALQPAAFSSLYADGEVVYHTHVNGIAEKFSNANDGIRQDFIIPVKPQGSGDLQVQLQVSGASVEQKNDGAVIALASGRRLTYNNLKVTDSAGNTMPASMHVANNTITLAVNDATAQYPLTIDPTVGDENWVSMGGLQGANGNVRAAVYSGSTLYIGGDFTAVDDVLANRIAKWDGSSWSALDSGMDNRVHALALDSNGNLYAGGDFTTAGGVTANRIAKWDGNSWSALGSGMDNRVDAIALDGNGNLYAGGDFITAGNVTVSHIAKWDGSSWSALGMGLNSTGSVYALALDGSGNLYVGGWFYTVGDVTVSHIAKWDGSSWSALGTGIPGEVRDLVLDGNGNLYAGGDFTSAGGVAANNIAKWDGSSWSALDAGMNSGTVQALALDGNGNLYAGGAFTAAGGVTANRIAKWDGSSWSTLGTGMDNGVLALALDGSGNLYTGGYFTTVDGVTANNIAKWDGSGWSALGTGMSNVVFALALDSNGNIYVGGWFFTVGNVTVSYIAKWDGSSWSALGTGMNGHGGSADVYALALDGNGNLYAGGYFTTAGGVAANNIAKWDGNSWSPLGSGMNAKVSALVVDSSGNLYAGGNFNKAGGVTTCCIAKWDGNSWSALGSGMDNRVHALALDGNGNLYAGGDFTAAGGVTANRIAKWDGSSWSAVGTGMDNTVLALASDDTGNLYAGGAFTAAGGVSANYIAKWDGNSWSPLGSGMSSSGYVYTLAPDGNGNLYAGGYFTTAGGVTANRIAKWDGSSWSTLGTGMNNRVYALALDSSGNLYAGGEFTTAGGKVSHYLAKWVGDVYIDTDSDGVPDFNDAFPLNPAEWQDTDSDGIGNNTDLDDDGDTVADAGDNCPLVANASQFDRNEDGIGDACDNPVPLPPDQAGSKQKGLLGSATAFAGDFNGDGYGDYVIGIPGFDAPAAQPIKDAGRGLVISGKNGAVIASINGTAPKDALGTAVAGGGDIDNDGYDDVVVGAPNAGATRAGSVTILYGPDGERSQTLTGAVAKSAFGAALALGDVNDDGHTDIIIGAPKDDNVAQGFKDAGSVTVYSGSDLGVQGTPFYGAAAKANAGSSLAAGDVNNDGSADIIVGAPGDGGVGSVKAYTQAGTLLLSKSGETTKVQFGKSVAAGDVNGDGYADVLVGAPMDDDIDNSLKDAGSITVFSGNGGIFMTKKYGAVAKAALGNSVAAGDVDADGKDDLIAGAWKDDKAASPKAIKDAGSVSIWSGNGYGPITTLYGVAAKDYFGGAVSAGDINSDGNDDLIIGIPGFDVPATKLIKDAGKVTAVSGAGL